jgi:hypothetical protein
MDKTAGYTLKNDVVDQESLDGGGMAIFRDENHPKMGIKLTIQGDIRWGYKNN